MMLGQPAVTGAEIPYGHQNTALKDRLVRAGCRSAWGDSPLAGDRERTLLAKGSNVGCRNAKAGEWGQTRTGVRVAWIGSPDLATAASRSATRSGTGPPCLQQTRW